jgi:succinyl-CoA synthetase alpha subunit
MAILAHATTRILVQGITGREAATFALESLRYGARIVAGVTPGRGGVEVHGVPVFDTVAAALHHHPCDATIISVPARTVRDAAWEALDHGIQLLVIITERIPRGDVVAILERASQVGARVIGPNSLGIICPGQTRIGMCGGSLEATRRAYGRGRVGILSRSGGMMTELASMLTQAGIGQSTCISVGGDPIIGSTFLDLLPLFEADAETQALVLFCEPGGTMEEQLAHYLTAHPSPLPIIAYVAGRFTDQRQGMRFGHAGAIVEGTQGSPSGKIAALAASGVIVAERVSHIPSLVRKLLEGEATSGHVYRDQA